MPTEVNSFTRLRSARTAESSSDRRSLRWPLFSSAEEISLILSCAASLRADRVPMFFLISERFSAEESWLSRFSSDSRSNTSILLSSAETAERSTSVSFSMTEMRAASFFRFCVFSAASSSISPIRVLLSAKTSSAAEICER